MSIELVVFDIDGVITDGTITVDSVGRELKKINLKDVDAIYELHRRGFRLAAITGEDTEIVDYFENRFPWEFFYRGKQTKKETMQLIERGTGIRRDKVCYIGDGKYDVEPLAYAGLGVCPADAVGDAKDAADIVLQKKGGDGCIWELLDILEEYNNDFSGHSYFFHRLTDHTDTFKQMASDSHLTNNLIHIGDLIIDTLKNNGALYLCGNGGSASDAQHIATEFVSRFYEERPGMNAEALSVNTSTITAIGNDYSFERIFVRQLEAKAKPGDIVIGISTSGGSKNVLQALRYAKEHDMIAVLMMGGFEKPTLREGDAADYILRVPSLVTPRIQEAHIFMGHVLAEYVEWRMYGDN